MIIISSGFPKSASTLLFLYTEHLITASGNNKGQEKFRRYCKDGFMPAFGVLNSLHLFFISMSGPIVIKTHSGPSFTLRLLQALGLAKAYYSIRDPRDVVLSALDHGAKARSNAKKSNSDIAFAPYHNRKELLPALQMHFARFKAWKKYGKALFVRYEDLIASPEQELSKVLQHINMSALSKYIPDTVRWFQERKQETINFNKGTVTRFQTELTTAEIAETEKDLREVILEMNYELTQ